MSTMQKQKAVIEIREKIDSLIHERYHIQARRHGLSLDQYHLLIELDELMINLPEDEAGVPVGKIAESVGSAQNTLSERVTRLEEKCLVRRVRDTKDRRINRVALSEQGRELIRTIGQDAGNLLLLKGLVTLDDDEIEGLLSSLQKLHSVMEKFIED